MVILKDEVDCSSASDFDQYDVFLSFRGPDTRTGFTNYLYRQLTGAGIQTFRDNDELEGGKSLENQLENAIEQSSISIIVFSPNYASSKWCLNELVRIFEQKNMRKVIPIFYKVDASDVRFQKGSYKEAFDEHLKKGRISLEKIKAWKEALTKAAGLSGFSLNTEYEDQFIDKIVSEVIRSLPKLNALGVPEPLLGMDYRVNSIHSWFKYSSSNVLLIWGIDGIGKTTIAKHIFNEYVVQFSGSSFLAWTNPIWDQNEAVVLQNQLLSNIQRKETKIYNYHEGIRKIEQAIHQKRVLLVLDDVNDTKQLDALLGQQQKFCPGSKIILTTRNEFLAKHFTVHHSIHKVQCLNGKDSLKLFSWHAFRQLQPPTEYKQLSEEILLRCEGLPLALSVLGGSLCKRKIVFWQSQLQKWDEIVDSSILKATKISYDSLEDDKVKSLFLHIACFFVGEEEDYTKKILDGCDLHATVGIQSLIDRCLISISEKKLMMHRVIQDMGHEIVRQESPNEHGQRSRLWYHEDSFTVLKNDEGTKAVKGLILDGQKIYKDEADGSGFAATNANPHSITKLIGYVKKKKEEVLDRFLYSNEGDLKFDVFAKMINLELVKLNYVHLTGNCNKFPQKLRWICWQGYPQEYVPMEVSLQKLIAFDLRYSLLKQVWKGYKEVKSLLILNLSYSHHLYTTPDFRGLKQLEKLILRGCSKLAIVCKTIGILQKLVLLDLRDCKSLRDVPELPKSIVTLELSGCDLGQFPRELQNVEPFDWKRIVKFASPSITTGPVKLLADLPHLLVSLNLEDCNLSDECFPRDFGGLSSLENMDLSGNLITRLPNCVQNLSNSRLITLSITDCSQLQSVINPPSTVNYFRLLGNRQLTKTKFRLDGALAIGIDEYPKYIEIEGVIKVVQTRNVDRKVIKNLGLESLLIDVSTAKVRYEFGIFSTCVEGREVPRCFTTFPITYTDVPCGSVTILYTIPSSVANKIQGLNICFAITLNPKRYKFPLDLEFEVTVCNKTKDCTWKYKSNDRFRGTPVTEIQNKPKVEVLWVSTWKCVDDLLESGDKIEVSFQIRRNAYEYQYEVKECGIRTVYVYEEDLEEDDEMAADGLLWTDEMNVSFYNDRRPGTTYSLQTQPSLIYGYEIIEGENGRSGYYG